MELDSTEMAGTDDGANTMRMFELAGTLIPSDKCTEVPDLMNSLDRKFLRQGMLTKNGNQRMVFLFSDMLLLTKVQQQNDQVRRSCAVFSPSANRCPRQEGRWRVMFFRAVSTACAALELENQQTFMVTSAIRACGECASKNCAL